MQKHFQSTRPVRGGTPSVAIITTERTISIHPPRAGRDVLVGVRAVRLLVISIHPPRAGRDKAINLICGDCMISIHPPRAGRDAGLSITLRGRSHFNPPAPCGAGLSVSNMQVATDFISIHPPRAGRDGWDHISHSNIAEFQSTRPVRGGTRKKLHRVSGNRFQSTRPVRGGTKTPGREESHLYISIHPPRAGRDIIYDEFIGEPHISIHPPRAGRDVTRHIKKEI